MYMGPTILYFKKSLEGEKFYFLSKGRYNILVSDGTEEEKKILASDPKEEEKNRRTASLTRIKDSNRC